MHEQPEPFSPQSVDEELAHYTAGSDQPVSITPSARLVHDMQRLYNLENQQYQRALQRVQERFLAGQSSLSEQATIPLRRLSRPAKGEGVSLTRPVRRPRRWLNLLAALLVTCLLIGGMLALVNLLHQNEHAAISPATVTPTHKATAVVTPTGKNTTGILHAEQADIGF